MSIPTGFSNSKEYFEKCLNFLQKYSWIYETSNTCFVRDNVLENFPIEWIEYFTTTTAADLNVFPSRQLKTNKCNLNDFLHELDELIPNPNKMSFPNFDYNFKKISAKKQHEISRLSSLIKTLCADNIDVLVDFGSGLGYLSELLHRENNYKIIGIEADSQRVQTSKDRQETFYPASKNHVVFKQHFITTDSQKFVLDEVNKILGDSDGARLAIVGLHSCADLTVNSMKLFFIMENVKKLIIMPCCYHKLETCMETRKSAFKNFPLSKVLKEAEAKKTSFRGFNRPFLRLACQQTSARWKNLSETEHHEHGMDMFIRGVAEAILNDDEIVSKCKGTKLKFLSDFSELTKSYELRSKSTTEQLTWTTVHQKRFLEIIQKYPNGPQISEGLTCLQTSMQAICENIVLYDRLCYMEEQANETDLKISVRFHKIMDEILSPRCYVLIAEKL